MNRIGLRWCNIGSDLRKHSSTVDCDTFLDEENVALVDQVTSVKAELIGSIVMFVSSFIILLAKWRIKNENVNTRVNGVQIFRWVSVREIENYSFTVKRTLSY